MIYIHFKWMRMAFAFFYEKKNFSKDVFIGRNWGAAMDSTGVNRLP